MKYKVLYEKQRLRVPVRCTRDGNSCEAVLSGFGGGECLLSLPKRGGFQIRPGDVLEVEVPFRDEGLKACKARVAKVRGTVCLLKEVTYNQEVERRRAERYPVHIQAEYCEIRKEKHQEFIKEGLIFNLSKVGLFLASPQPLDPGNSLVVMFKIKWGEIEAPVGVLGTIVREQKNMEGAEPEAYRYGYGIRFNSPRMAV